MNDHLPWQYYWSEKPTDCTFQVMTPESLNLIVYADGFWEVWDVATANLVISSCAELMSVGLFAAEIWYQKWKET